MEAANLTFNEAREFMKQGYVMSPNLGSYDYYILKETKSYGDNGTALVLCGYDMSDLHLIQPDELEIIEKTTWHVISGPWEEYGK